MFKLYEKKHFIKIILVLCVSFLLEIFLFNWNHWRTPNGSLEKIDLKECFYNADAFNVLAEENAEYAILKSAIGGMNGLYFKIGDANMLDSISICAYAKGDKAYYYDVLGNPILEKDISDIVFRVYAYDVNNNDYKMLYDGLLCSDGELVYYNIPKHEKSDYYYLALASNDNCEVVVTDIVINAKNDFGFSIFRFVICICILSLIAFRKVFLKYMRKQMNMKYFITFTFLVAIICSLLPLINPLTRNVNIGIDSYNDLAHSLINGKVSVHDEMAHSLDALDNPYDWIAREESGIPYLHDYAYYNGKYYVYFGVVPCIVFYLPWIGITGKSVLNSVVLSIVIFFMVLGMMLLLKDLINRYYLEVSKFSIGKFTFLALLLLFGSMIPFIAGFPMIYHIAQASAVMFVIWGLLCYTKAGYKDNNVNVYILIGSLCFALSAGCRPLITLSALLSIPLLKEKMLKKEKVVIKHWCSFIVPYVVVAVFLMYYNYIRFGSVLDFGSNYNLTIDNIKDVTLNFNKIKSAIMLMFLDIPKFNLDFPFIQHVAHDYNINNLNKETIGGFFMTNIICCLSFLPIGCFVHKKNFSKDLLLIQYLSLSLTFFLGITAVVMNGCIERYKFDFGFLASLATVAVFIEIFKGKIPKYLKIIFGLLLLTTILINCSMYFYTEPMIMKDYNMEMFDTISRQFMFWV